VRLDLPMNLVAALDGLAHIDNSNRKLLCETAVREYIERRLGEFSLVLKMARSNAVDSD
jgi:predicted transcriptional regulator